MEIKLKIVQRRVKRLRSGKRVREGRSVSSTKQQLKLLGDSVISNYPRFRDLNTLPPTTAAATPLVGFQANETQFLQIYTHQSLRVPVRVCVCDS